MTPPTKHVCQNEAEHTPQPKDYRDWHLWAEKMAKTHHQIECPGCGLYQIWVPSEKAVRS